MSDVHGALRLPMWTSMLIAVGLVTATLFLRLSLGFYLGDQPVLIVYILPIAVSGYLGGLRTGVVATAVAALLSNYFLLPPLYSLAIERPVNRIQWVVLWIIGIGLSYLLERLHRSNEFHTVTLAGIGEAVLAADRDGRITFLNSAASALIGCGKNEQPGRKIESVFRIPETGGHEREGIVQRVLRAGCPLAFSDGTSLVDRNGRAIPIEGNATAVRDRSGNASGVVMVFRDVSEKLAARDSLALLNQDLERRLSELQTIFDTVPVGLAIADDPQGLRIRGNRANEQMMGVSSGGQLSKRGPDAAAYRAFEDGCELPVEGLPMQRAVRGETVIGQIMDVVREDGQTVTLYCNASPLLDENGKPRGAVGAFLDVTEIKRAQEALQRSEERLRLAQLSANVGIWDWNLQTGEQNFTPELDTIYGVEPGTIVAYEDWRRRVHPADIERVEAACREAVARREPFDLEFRICHSSGRLRWINTKGSAICDRDGNPVRLLGVNLDVTDRKEADGAIRRSENRYRELVQSANSAIIRWKKDGTIAFFNEYAQNFFGYREEEAIGGNVRMLMPGEESSDAGVINLVEEIVKHPECHLQHINENIRRDGSLVWMAWTNRAMFDEDGNLTEILAVGTDITDRKRMEEELRQSRDELEFRVRERTAELESYMKRLTESNQALRDFASIASHDMQEPLRKVTFFGDQIKRKYGDSLGETGLDYLDRMLNAAERMRSLLHSLLDYSRVTTTVEPFGDVDLSGLVREVLSDLEARIENTGGVVEIGNLPFIHADPIQMRQLFQNLIGNALKFHREGERPLVKVQCRESDRYLRISVEDNGIGFDEVYCDRIFAPFHRLHGRSAYEGTGMGLAICRKIVERHGGTITAKSVPGQGSTFLITLPAEQEARLH